VICSQLLACSSLSLTGVAAGQVSWYVRRQEKPKVRRPVEYTAAERFWLAVLGVFGFVAVNGAFVYGLLVQPDAMTAALTNPLAAAFIAEALVLVGVFAYLFERWGVSRLGWGWFVFLSLLGSMAFAIPIVLLFPRSDAGRAAKAPDAEPDGRR
jgi:hypothetical protein